MLDRRQKKREQSFYRRSFCVQILELAVEIGISPKLASLLRVQLGLPGVVKGDVRLAGDARKRMFVTRLGAAAIRVAYWQGKGGREAYAGWMLKEEAAAGLGLSVPGFERRWHRGALGVRRIRIAGPKTEFRFSPDDIQIEAKRLGVKAKGIPRGKLSTVELTAAAGGKTVWTVRKWTKDGCPRHKTRDNSLYFDPAEVIEWLEARGGVQLEYAARLRRVL